MGRIDVRAALLFYAGMLAVALAWGAIRGDVNVFVLKRDGAPPRPELPWSVGLGIAFGLAGVGLSRLAARFGWARRLGEELRRLLGELTLRDVTLLAVASAVGEEAFFRGAMQPSLGYVATSLVFGLLHVGPSRAFLPWTIWAIGAGFALGAITEYTGDLLAATLGHFTVNYFNLWQLGVDGGRASR